MLPSLQGGVGGGSAGSGFYGQYQLEVGATAHGVAQQQVAVVGLCQHLGVGESEAGAEGGGHAVVAYLIVEVENLVAVAGRHAGAIVDDGDAEVAE